MSHDNDLEDIKELREEIRSLKADLRRQVAEAVRGAGRGSIKVEVAEDEMAQAEPSSVVAKDLVRLIRDNVRSSLVEKGERAVDDLVDSMPTDKAADLLKSLANTERIKIAKLLYNSRMSFSDIGAGTDLKNPSVIYHINSLKKMGLVSHSDEGGYELTRRGRLLVRTLALMNEALGGESID
jgi:DNA-binding transcriptional ArsR family regulator